MRNFSKYDVNRLIEEQAEANRQAMADAMKPQKRSITLNDVVLVGIIIIAGLVIGHELSTK